MAKRTAEAGRADEAASAACASEGASADPAASSSPGAIPDVSTPAPADAAAPADAWAFAREGRFWCVTVALACLVVTTNCMNSMVFPLFDGVFAPARDLSVAANVVVLMAAGAFAAFKPRLLHIEAFDVATAAFLIVGSVLVVPGLAAQLPWLLTLAACLQSIGRAGVAVVIGLAATGFDRRRATVSVAVAFSAGYAGMALLALVPPDAQAFAGLMLFAILPLVSFVITFRAAQPLLEEVAGAEAPADRAITKPATYLPLSSAFFVTIFMFRVAFGFSLRFNEVGGVPVSDVLLVVPIVALCACTLLRRRLLDADVLAQVAVVLVALGFYLLSASPRALFLPGNVFLSAGNTLFSMVAWVVLMMLAGRNRTGAFVVLAWGRGLSGLGSLVGAGLGLAANGLAAADWDAFIVLTAVILTAFLAYTVIGLRRFSFKEVIAGVEDAQAEEQAAISEEAEPVARFEARCDAIAAQYGLSPREREVFGMLARGRDRLYIEEQLVISKNTVKVHVRHIYAKLGIHSQQDLIALVQD